MPKIAKSPDRKITFEEGKAANLTIDISNVQSVKWFHNGVELTENTNIAFQADGDRYSLCLKDPTKDNVGEYKIEATSSTGNVVQKSFTVDMEGRTCFHLSVFSMLSYYIMSSSFF